jgi:uncharacterized membrane protein YfcA
VGLVSNLILMGLIFSAAVLYASVGHAGASGYLAAMALVGISPLVMKPSALVLNVLVAAVTTVKFCRAGCITWRLLWPFAAASVPLAFIGGIITMPGHAYQVVVGMVLLFAAYWLWFGAAASTKGRPLSVPLALIFGGGIGLLSGLTGVGGGIFLSPLMMLLGWGDYRQISGVSAAFILVNSIAALFGYISSLSVLQPEVGLWALAAIAGGWIGAEYGSKRLASWTIRRLLAIVLAVAGIKMILV